MPARCAECNRLLTPENSVDGELCTSCSFTKEELLDLLLDACDKPVTVCSNCGLRLFENDPAIHARGLIKSNLTVITAFCSEECHQLYRRYINA